MQPPGFGGELSFREMGYFAQALADFEQCLEIDAGYLLCSRYLASGLLYLGQIEAAIRQSLKEHLSLTFCAR